MKQMIILVAIMIYCTLRSFIDPFWATLLYFSFAVLRPQSIWEWSLPQGIRWSLFAAILAIAMAAIHYRALKPRVVQKNFIVILFIYAALLFASYMVAFNREVADKYGWEYLKIFVMIIVGTRVITQRVHMRYLGLMIFACLTYLVYEVNALYVFDNRLDVFHNGYGGLDNNGAGLMLAMAIPFCYHFFLAEQRWWRWGYFVCVIPAAHAVMLTNSRGAMLSSIVCGLAMTLTATRQRLMSVLAIAVLGIFILVLAGQGIRDRFMSIDSYNQDGSAQSRFDSWQAGVNIALDYPLFGVGIRHSDLISKKYGADKEGRAIHNLYIQVLADSGFAAAGVYITMVFLSLKWLLGGARKAKETMADAPDLRWHHHLCKAAFWSLATFAFGSFFLSLEQFELSYLLMLMAACAPALAGETAKLAPSTLNRNRNGQLSYQNQSGGI